MNIDFFINHAAREHPVIYNWNDIENLFKEYQKNKHLILTIPEEYLNQKEYYYQLTTHFPKDTVYRLFSENIQLDEDIIKDIFSTVIENENLSILSQPVLNDFGWMMILLTKKPYLYHHIGDELKHDINFNIRLLKAHTNRFYFQHLHKEVLFSYDFLIACQELIFNKKLHSDNVKNFIEKEYNITVPSVDFENTFDKILLNKKIEKELTSNILPHRTIKI